MQSKPQFLSEWKELGLFYVRLVIIIFYPSCVVLG